MNGFVKNSRELLEHPIFTQTAPAVAKVAWYFTLRASYKPAQWYDGVTVVDIPAGSFITSYNTVARDCNLSVQQVRDAFDHLERTQIGTYRRTHRWTLVTVSNWVLCQASPEEAEHTVEHKVEQDRNRIGTGKEHQIKKEERRKKKTPLRASDDALGSELPQTEEPPLFPESVSGTGHVDGAAVVESSCEILRAGRDWWPGRAKAIRQIAARIHERHPNAFGRRDCSVAQVEKKLTAAIRRHRFDIHAEELLDRIDHNHAGWCASDAWQKDGGQFAKSLENWLAQTKERYLVDPPAPAQPQSTDSIYEYWDPPKARPA